MIIRTGVTVPNVQNVCHGDNLTLYWNQYEFCDFSNFEQKWRIVGEKCIELNLFFT